MPVDNVSPVLQSIGSYDLLERLAEGGMGTVYRGRHRLTGATVAVKVMPKHLLSNPVYLKRFEQEYCAARVLDHPNVVRALDFGRDGDEPYLVMEFVEGESLGQRIQRGGRLSEQEAIDIVAQVAEGLHKAHQLGLIHRDVKPDNIMVTPGGKAKLTDLGLVKELEADLNLTRTGRGLGTPHFMAPEQFRNAKKADVRCDIYSLAATFYMMVTGQLPFRSNGPLDAWMKKVNNEIEPARAFVPDLSERVERAIERGMNPDPALRPESCTEFVADLTGSHSLSDTKPNLGGSDIWHVLYRGGDGAAHIRTATVAEIRRSVQEGVFGAPGTVRIAPTSSGPFEPLLRHEDFRDLGPEEIPAPEPEKRPEPTAKIARQRTPVNGKRTAGKVVRSSTKDTHVGACLPTSIAAEPTHPPSVASGPHIELGVDKASTHEEAFKWVAFLVIAVSTAGLGYYAMPFLVPLLLRLRGL